MLNEKKISNTEFELQRTCLSTGCEWALSKG